MPARQPYGKIEGSYNAQLKKYKVFKTHGLGLINVKLKTCVISQKEKKGQEI